MEPSTSLAYAILSAAVEKAARADEAVAELAVQMKAARKEAKQAKVELNAAGRATGRRDI